MSIHSSAEIHSSAIIETGAVIAENVKIGPFCVIGKDVVIEKDCSLKSHVVVEGMTNIGEKTKIYPFVTIGMANQDLKYKGEQTQTIIGKRNQIRESVTIHRGTVQGGGHTTIGDDNLIMVAAHIAHDCQLGNGNILANNATLGGHVNIGDYAIIGGLSAVHQFCTIGSHVMIGGCSGVAQDVPPYFVGQGNHAKPFGVNKIGLKRHQFSQEQIMRIYDCYKILYKEGLPIEEAKNKIAELAEKYSEIKRFMTFFSLSTRGIIR